jgi:hypothetical protein
MPALAAAALAAALTVPVTPTISTVADDPGHLVAGGTAVQISITVRCNLDALANVYGDVSQTVDGKTAAGGFFTTVQCLTSAQRILVTVTPYTDRAFRKGAATVDAQGYVCGEVECAFAPDGPREITIRK